MNYSRPLFLLATVVVIVGACIGIGMAVLIRCQENWCMVSHWGTSTAVRTFDECAAQGYPVMESFPRQCRTPGNILFVEGESASSSSQQASQNNMVNIIVTDPSDGTPVQYVFEIAGEARVFENVVNYRVRDEDGSVVAEGVTEAKSPDVGQFGPFSVSVDVSKAKGAKGLVEVFQSSPKDGSEVDKVTLHVTFSHIRK